jgi:predicted ATP-dependent endonuclease of OLD family
MLIVYLEVQNFRGIKSLVWAPATGMNCLIGPGDSPS